MEETPAPPHIKRASFPQAAYRCKNNNYWFINTLYAYMNVIYQKKRRDKAIDEWNSMLIVPNDERILARQR
jgi:hypothetical protein